MKEKSIYTDSRFYKIIKRIKNVTFAVILAMLVTILVFTMWARVSGKTPYVAGLAVYRISSGSMYPELKTGEVILSQQCDPLTLKNGDIITYQGTVGEFKDKIVTHRVVHAPYKQGNEYYLVTKGDDNPAYDTPINTDKVLGKMVCKLELITFFYNFFITPWGLIVMLLLIILAFFNEIIILIQTITGFKKDDKDNLDCIIEKYKKKQKAIEAAKKPPASERNLRPTRGQRYFARVKPPKGRMTNREKSILNSNPRRKKR